MLTPLVRRWVSSLHHVKNTHTRRTCDTTWCHVTSCHATCHHTTWCDVGACCIHRRCQRRYMILRCLIKSYLRLRQRILHTQEIQVTPHAVTLQDITLHEVTHSIRDFTSKLNYIISRFFCLVYARACYIQPWLAAKSSPDPGSSIMMSSYYSTIFCRPHIFLCKYQL